jgi:hypothetical protein
LSGDELRDDEQAKGEKRLDAVTEDDAAMGRNCRHERRSGPVDPEGVADHPADHDEDEVHRSLRDVADEK